MTTCEIQAIKDISEEYKKEKRNTDERDFKPWMLRDKEIRRLNRELGIDMINLNDGRKNNTKIQG